MARISPDKKLEQLIDAIRMVIPNSPDFELLIAGAPDVGAEEYALHLRARAADLPVTWIGHMDPVRFYQIWTVSSLFRSRRDARTLPWRRWLLDCR